MLRKYRWPGNIRQLKNMAEKISALESAPLSSTCDRCEIDVDVLMKYIPREESNLLPATIQIQEKMDASDKEVIVRMLLQLKQEVDYLKGVVESMTKETRIQPELPHFESSNEAPEEQGLVDEVVELPVEDMSLKTLGNELIEKVLRKHGGNRKAAAAELGISERTLYRRLKK